MTQDKAIQEAFELLIGTFEVMKERYRGNEAGRRYAITLTLLEQSYAYYMFFISKWTK